jgi:hypothetical protein
MPAGLTIDTDAPAGPEKTSALKLTPEEEAATKAALKNATKRLSNEVAVLRYAKNVKGNTDPTVADMLEKKEEQLDKARRGSFFKVGGKTRKHKRKTRRTKKRRV